jgi:2-polyprenyl-3-methyl-5-hydroxy-6-metoxy-1,4-benzoquinol methylase
MGACRRDRYDHGNAGPGDSAATSGAVEHLPAGVSSDAPSLDVGCGTGAWLARLAERGFKNLTGIDSDTDQTRIERDRGRRHVENLGIFF